MNSSIAQVGGKLECIIKLGNNQTQKKRQKIKRSLQPDQVIKCPERKVTHDIYRSAELELLNDAVWFAVR